MSARHVLLDRHAPASSNFLFGVRSVFKAVAVAELNCYSPQPQLTRWSYGKCTMRGGRGRCPIAPRAYSVAPPLRFSRLRGGDRTQGWADSTIATLPVGASSSEYP